MRILELDSQTNLHHILNELKNTTEDGLEITLLPNEKTTLENPLHRSIIQKVADFYKKEIVMPVEDIEQVPETEGDELGFIEGEDILTKTPMEEVQERLQPASVTPTTITPSRKMSFGFLKNIKSKPLLAVGALILILAVLAGSFFLLPSATVNIDLASKSKDTQVTLVAGVATKEADLEKNEIPLATSEVTKTSTDQISTTGKKTIGTYATGRVTITNRDNQDKTFVKGTILTPVAGDSSVKLNEEVFIKKPDIFGGEEKAGANVTAVNPGEGGNIVANTTFKVGSESSPLVFAKNDVALSGGSTKEAKVASSEDRQALKDKILEKITKEAESEVKSKVKGSILPEGSIETKVTKETYEPKTIDAEAEILKATITIQAKANLIQEEDLKKIMINSLEKTEKDFKVSEDNLTLTAQQTENNGDGSIKLLGKAKVELIPEISENEIIKNIKGKSLASVKNYLNNQENISGYTVNIAPSFVRIFGFLPFSSNKIKINFN